MVRNIVVILPLISDRVEDLILFHINRMNEFATKQNIHGKRRQQSAWTENRNLHSLSTNVTNQSTNKPKYQQA